MTLLIAATDYCDSLGFTVIQPLRSDASLNIVAGVTIACASFCFLACIHLNPSLAKPSGASAVQQTCPVLQGRACSACMHAVTASSAPLLT